MPESILLRKGRAADLFSLRVSFFTPQSSEEWPKVLGGIGLPVDEALHAQPEWRSRTILMLVSDNDYVTHIDIHPCAREGHSPEVHWVFEVEERPKTDPPESILGVNKATGGAEAVLAKLAELWSLNHETPRADVRAVFSLSEERWHPKLAGKDFTHPWDFSPAGAGAESPVRIRPVSTLFEVPEHSHLTEITLIHPSGENFAIGVNLNAEVALTPRLFQDADELAWNNILPLLAPRS